MTADALLPEVQINKVRLIRWEGGEEPKDWDRAHPERHPRCLEVRLVDEHGLHITLWERGQSCR